MTAVIHEGDVCDTSRRKGLNFGVVSGLLCELAYVQIKNVTSIDIIIDCNNFSLKHIYSLSRKFAKRMMFFMSECLPMELLHIYVVRQPRIFYVAYSLFKPFIEDRMKKL
ncbi:hypothetical protein NQ317_004437, partial [Molorchus minor]